MKTSASTAHARPLASPELVPMLVLAMRAQDGAAVDEQVLRIAERGLDWDAFVTAAGRNGLGPMAHALLSRVSARELIPEQAVDRLNTMRLSQLVLSADHMQDLGVILSRAAATGIQPIVMKGPVVAATAYSEPGLRPYVDFDLLVRERDWSELYALMSGLGYETHGRPLPQLPLRLVDHDMLDHCLRFEREGRLRIECKLDPLELGLRMRRLDAVFSSPEEIRSGNVVMHALPLPYQLVTMCVHLNRHGYRRLVWFQDIAGLLTRRGDELDWESVAHICREEVVAVSVYHTLRAVNDLLAVAPPAEAMLLLRPSSIRTAVWVRYWPDDDVRGLRGREDGPIVFRRSIGPRWLLSNVLLTGRPKEKLTYFARKAFPRHEYVKARSDSAGERQGYLRLLTRRYTSAIVGALTNLAKRSGR